MEIQLPQITIGFPGSHRYYFYNACWSRWISECISPILVGQSKFHAFPKLNWNIQGFWNLVHTFAPSGTVAERLFDQAAFLESVGSSACGAGWGSPVVDVEASTSDEGSPEVVGSEQSDGSCESDNRNSLVEVEDDGRPEASIARNNSSSHSVSFLSRSWRSMSLCRLKVVNSSAKGSRVNSCKHNHSNNIIHDTC